MKHRALANAISDAVTDELKPLLAPLIAAEFARQRAGGDSNAPPALPALTRSPDRARIRTRVLWSAREQLAIQTTITAAIASALAERAHSLALNAVVAEKIADGSAALEFAEYQREAQRVPAEHTARRATIAHVKDLPRCAAEAQARAAVAGLIASMRAKRERRGRAA